MIFSEYTLITLLPASRQLIFLLPIGFSPKVLASRTKSLRCDPAPVRRILIWNKHREMQVQILCLALKPKVSWQVTQQASAVSPHIMPLRHVWGLPHKISLSPWMSAPFFCLPSSFTSLSKSQSLRGTPSISKLSSFHQKLLYPTSPLCWPYSYILFDSWSYVPFPVKCQVHISVMAFGGLH